MEEDVRLQRIRELEKKLKARVGRMKIDEDKQATQIRGFDIRTAEDSIIYVDYTRNLQKKYSPWITEEEIQWPYTGFTEGSFGLVIKPISPEGILELIDKFPNHCRFESFVDPENWKYKQIYNYQ